MIAEATKRTNIVFALTPPPGKRYCPGHSGKPCDGGPFWSINMFKHSKSNGSKLCDACYKEKYLKKCGVCGEKTKDLFCDECKDTIKKVSRKMKH